MITSHSGLIVAELEESVAAPGTGEGVYGVSCSIVTAVIDGTVTAVVYFAPPDLSQSS